MAEVMQSNGTETSEGAAKVRARRNRSKSGSAATAAKAAGSAAGGELTCPECGRTFGRAAALGAHRRSHGVAGRSATATKSRSARGRLRSGGQGRGSSSARSSSSNSGTGTRSGRGSSSGAQQTGSRRGGGGIDRDALLRALFPNGVPAREQTLNAVGAWLDEAERLARVR